MSEIPDGPARIEWLEANDDSPRFRWVSFPAHLRGHNEALYADDLANVGKWRARSILCPDVLHYDSANKLLCPGSNKTLDDIIIRWNEKGDILVELLDQINARRVPISAMIARILGLVS